MSVAREIADSEHVLIQWTDPVGQPHTTEATKVLEVYPGPDGRLAVVLVLDGEPHA